MTDAALIIFIKNPALGKVKTRVARTAGNAAALDIYRALLAITQKNAQTLWQNTACHCYLFYSDFVDTSDDWQADVFEKHVQTGADLGARMKNAFDFILKKHQRVAIIGSDCPTLSVEILTQTFTQLLDYEVVIGPSTDGGYYLLGVNGREKNDADIEKLLSLLFDDVAWSTEQVLPTTQKRLDADDKKYALLTPLTDVDEEKDWVAYKKLMADG